MREIFCRWLWVGLFLMGVSLSFGAEVRVFAAASLYDALKEISGRYEKETGEQVTLNIGASSILARQIEAGAPADIFISADEQKMDQLQKKGFVREETRRDLLSNTLVAVARKESPVQIRSAGDLKHCARIAIAEPRSVPAGIYARRYLEQKGLWADLEGKMVPAENVRGALAAVESGNVDAGIVYKTDAQISQEVKVLYKFPVEETPWITYPAAVLKEARAGAERFVTELSSERSRQTFEKFGFICKIPLNGK